MITKERLYEATDEGLEILELHYPGAAHSAKTNEPFRVRSWEKTPSARVKRFKTSSGGYVWKVTDFGIEAKAMSPIEVHMKEKGMEFAEAIADLASIFGITETLNKTINRPDIRKLPATSDQPDGGCFWELNQDFTKRELEIMGPFVKADHMKAMNWYRARFIATTKNRETTYKYSTEHYAIFMRECWYETQEGEKKRFYKIYEPENPDKKWRFQYRPAGEKPQSFINGLYELQEAYRKMNEAEEKAFFKDPANEGKPFKTIKLESAFICSGERDAICVKSLGEFPLWFNSETYNISPAEIRQIQKYVKTIYNIPDLDATGVAKGRELSLKYIDICTVWLPESLKEHRDNRGRPMKDFRDWIGLVKDKYAFKNLVMSADPVKFWYYTQSEDGAKKYSISSSCLTNFIEVSGFYNLKDESSNTVSLVKITGNVVSPVSVRDIRNYVIRWARENGLPRALRDLIGTTKLLTNVQLENLATVTLDFSSATSSSQLFYFPRFAVKVTRDKIEKVDTASGGASNYVWEENIIPHDIRILPDMFEITHPEGSVRSEDFDISILDNRSCFFRYLINGSRNYWRKELEIEWNGKPVEEAAKYQEDHKFDIAGPLLTDEEIQEQKRSLINKIFCIGYMLHRYKELSKPWAPFVMDNTIGENDQCNGGSGKSFMFRALDVLSSWLSVDGRSKNLCSGQFSFEQVSEKTDIVTVDDCSDNFPFKDLYSKLSGDLTINPKYISTYNLGFWKAPKFSFTTNYVPREFSPSTVRRMIFCVFSDYYHTASEENDYIEDRPIRSDFGKDIMARDFYSEHEWEADINFMLQCVKFYLSVHPLGIKIQPKIDNILFRKHMRDMSANFADWAAGYFAIDDDGKGEHLDCMIIREKAFEDYLKYSGTRMSMRSFTTALKGFCYVTDYIDCLNPEELLNRSGRIQKRIINPVTNVSEVKDMIYIKTKDAEIDYSELDNPPTRPTSPTTPATNGKGIAISDLFEDAPDGTLKPRDGVDFTKI